MTTLLIIVAGIALAPVALLFGGMLCALILSSMTRQEQERRDGTQGG